MRNSKKIIIPILVILILLLIAGGAFAYVYMATDLLKTDKEVFFKYFSQITAEDGLIDKRINDFNEKKKQNSYKNNGEITAEVEYPDESLSQIIEKIKDLSIRFEGQVDNVNQNLEQNIKIDYGNDVVFPLKYRQDGNNYGIQIDGLSSKFIAIRNENLEELLGNIITDDGKIVSSQDKIQSTTDLIDKLNKAIEFTEEEQKQLKEIYGTVLEQQLLEENFSSVKDGQNVSYTLELSFEQVKNIIIKMLEATKQNTLIIDKLNEIALLLDEDVQKMEVSDIDEIIENIKDEDSSGKSNIKLTLVQSNKFLNQIILETQDKKLTIEKSIKDNNLNYIINSEINETADSNSILQEEKEISEKFNCHFNVKYAGLENLNSVQEIYEIGFSTTSEDKVMKYDYKINCNTDFVESVSVEELDKDVALFLNDYNESQLTPFLGQVATRISEINKKQMNKLGLKENENPLFYSNPITMLVISFANMASETVNGMDLPQEETEGYATEVEESANN